mgnify:CR=1 FL=1
MTITSLLILAVTGLIAGWLGSLVFKGHGLGLLGNIIVGILGGIVGGWLFNLLGLSLRLFKGDWSWLNGVIIAAIGAIIILAIVNFLFKKKKK